MNILRFGGNGPAEEYMLVGGCYGLTAIRADELGAYLRGHLLVLIASVAVALAWGHAWMLAR